LYGEARENRAKPVGRADPVRNVDVRQFLSIDLNSSSLRGNEPRLEPPLYRILRRTRFVEVFHVELLANKFESNFHRLYLLYGHQACKIFCTRAISVGWNQAVFLVNLLCDIAPIDNACELVSFIVVIGVPKEFDRGNIWT